MQALYKETLAALQELLKSVLAKDLTPDGLQSVFKVKLQTPQCSFLNYFGYTYNLRGIAHLHFSLLLRMINRKKPPSLRLLFG